jgi:hypothetical protein
MSPQEVANLTRRLDPPVPPAAPDQPPPPGAGTPMGLG